MSFRYMAVVQSRSLPVTWRIRASVFHPHGGFVGCDAGKPLQHFVATDLEVTARGMRFRQQCAPDRMRVQHLRLLVGKDSIANALIRHFGSLKALSRASFRELRQFLPRRQAEAVMVALSMGTIAETEHALSTPLTNAEAIYKANLDMKAF
jgi:uncharacterized protein (DUF1684 family)